MKQVFRLRQVEGGVRLNQMKFQGRKEIVVKTDTPSNMFMNVKELISKYGYMSNKGLLCNSDMIQLLRVCMGLGGKILDITLKKVQMFAEDPTYVEPHFPWYKGRERKRLTEWHHKNYRAHLAYKLDVTRRVQGNMNNSIPQINQSPNLIHALITLPVRDFEQELESILLVIGDEVLIITNKGLQIFNEYAFKELTSTQTVANLKEYDNHSEFNQLLKRA